MTIMSKLSPAKRDLIRHAQRFPDFHDAQAHHDAIARARANPQKALRNLKDRHRERMRNLRDPKWGDNKRGFPKWTPGMTTEMYIAAYTPSCTQRIVEYTHRRGVAPWIEQEAAA